MQLHQPGLLAVATPFLNWNLQPCLGGLKLPKQCSSWDLFVYVQDKHAKASSQLSATRCVPQFWGESSGGLCRAATALQDRCFLLPHCSSGSAHLFQTSASITKPHLDPRLWLVFFCFSAPGTSLLMLSCVPLSFLFALPRSSCPSDLWVVWRSSKHYLRIIYMSCLFHLIMPFFNMLSSSFLAGSSPHSPNACLACMEAFLFFK